MARQSLEQWVQEALADTEKAGPCTAIALLHVSGNGSENCLHLTKIGAGRAWTAKDLAGMLKAKAESYAQDLPGVQMMQLRAFYNGSQEPEAVHPFAVAGQTDNLNLGTEAPDERGERQQRMRHTEAMTQGMMRERAILLEHSIELLREHRQFTTEILMQLRSSERDRSDYVRVAEEAILRRAADDRQARREHAEYERNSQLMTAAAKLLPPIVNQVTGKEIFPQSTADSALIDSFAESMTSEQLQMLSSMLRPDQMALLATRIAKSAQKSHEREQSAARREPEALTDANDVENAIVENTNTGSAA